MTGHTPAEWAAVGSLGLSAVGLLALALSFADADARYFDPRPVVRRALEVGSLRPVWQVAIHAGHDVNRAVHASHEAFRDAAALLILLTTSPKGATR